MTIDETIKSLEDMDRQIIHGTKFFSETAALIRDMRSELERLREIASEVDVESIDRVLGETK